MTSRTWKYVTFDSNSGLYIEFKFTKNKKLELIENSFGIEILFFRGYYQIQKDKLIINYEIGDPYMTPEESKKASGNNYNTIKCELTDSHNDVKFEKYLKCEGHLNYRVFIISDDYKYKSDIPLKYNGKDVITVQKQGCAIDNVKMREQPNVQSKTYKYMEGYFEKYYDFLPKGKCFQALARTKEKFQVDKWNNYWYIIQLDGYQKNNVVWVYGEFIKIK